MSEFLKYATVCVLVVVVAAYCVYFSGILTGEDSSPAPEKQRAADVAAPAPEKQRAADLAADPADPNGLQEFRELLAALDSRSIDQLNAFLAVHGSGFYAQVARVEVAKLSAAKTSAPAATVSSREFPQGKAESDDKPQAPPSPDMEVGSLKETAPADPVAVRARGRFLGHGITPL